MDDGFIPKHGGYQNLLAYQLAVIIFDFTVRFVHKYIPQGDRTRDQMIQAARSSKANIEEGSVDSAGSKNSEIKLTVISKGSLHELRTDYQDYLRLRRFPQWKYGNQFALEIFRNRFQTADDLICWIGRHKDYPPDCFGANAVIVLINLTLKLVNNLISAQEKDFMENGGIKERMNKARLKRRNNPPSDNPKGSNDNRGWY